MELSPTNITLPMELNTEVQVVYEEIVFVGPFAESLNKTLTSLDDTMIPETTRVLPDYFFQNNENLSTVNLTNITSIGSNEFNGCAITSLTMPSLETAGMMAFAYNPMTSVNLPALNTIGTQAFQRCENLKVADFLSVEHIMQRAFYYCSSLDTLILRANQVVELQGTQHFYQTKIESGQGYIYVPDNLVDSYKAAEGWSAYTNQIRSIDELEG